MRVLASPHLLYSTFTIWSIDSCLKEAVSRVAHARQIYLRTLLFIMATMMDSSVLWKYFAWNVLDFFSLTFRTRQIEPLSLGKITRM